jgi:3-oxoacyl-[acyl-carrier protein] reductase
MDLGLAGKSVLVVGGSAGIGRAAAELLLAEGAQVTIAARDPARLAEAAAALRAATGTAPATALCDAGDPEAVAALLARWEDAPLQALVSAFGGSFRSAFASLTDAQWLANYELNILGTVRVVRAALPALGRAAAAGSARVVLLGAASARQPTAQQAVSNVHKAGLLALAKTLANELAPQGIGVNTVSPGRALTPLWQSRAAQMARDAGTTPEAVLAKAAEDIPFGRFATAEEVARMVVFLASGATAYVTGQNIQVDGGLVRGV